MDASTFNELNELLSNLTKERNELQKNIDDNNLHIHEAQSFEDEIMSRNEEDFKVFSPRKYEDIYRVELGESIDRKSSYENKNHVLIEKKDKLDSIIHVLEAAAQDWKIELDTKEQQLRDGLAGEQLTVKNKLFSLEVQEESNKRLIEQLNDTVIQDLSHAMNKMEIASKFIGQDPARAKLELSSVSKNIQQSILSVRNIIFELCPMDFEQFTFEHAIYRMITAFNQNNRYEMDLQIDDIKNVSCENKAWLISVYKVIQECFLNIRKHADAKKILFHCKKEEDKLFIRIEDDGKGLRDTSGLQNSVDVKSSKEVSSEKNKNNGFGISMMKEKVFLLNGRLEISTSSGEGTRIFMEIPIL